MSKKVVIIGGVAGGAATAARLRRLCEKTEIILFEKDEYISFANCGLPYYIGGVTEKREMLIIQTPEAMGKRFNLDIRNNSEVVRVDTAKKTVYVNSLSRGEYEESYDVLVVSPGVVPSTPPFEITAPDRVFTLRTIPDTDNIVRYIDQNSIPSAVVIGGGFVGVEMAENLRERGLEVTLIESAKHILPPFDGELSGIVEEEMAKHGVSVLTDERVSSITEGDGHAVVTTQSGKTISAGMVISAVGVTPSTKFLADSGINMTASGHILTDDAMMTNIPDVYAIGDAVLVRHFVTGELVPIPLAGPAAKQGRLVADRIHGLDHRYKGTQGTTVIKVFSLTAACTGANERTLQQQNIPYTVIYTHPFSHAGYYPGAVQMSCKLLFAPDGKILGCQIVGEKGAERRLDVVATAMRLGATADQLCELELSYAPPFSTAKDPVNMLGYIAQNILKGNANLVDYHYAQNRDVDKTILLDVRFPEEFERGHLPGAINIPVDELRDNLDQLDKSKEIIEYCQVGIRSHAAERILSNNGFQTKNVSGGWKTLARAEEERLRNEQKN